MRKLYIFMSGMILISFNAWASPALWRGVLDNQIDQVKSELTHGADPNYVDEHSKFSVLHLAAGYNRSEILNELLTAGSRLDLELDENGSSALHLACENNSSESAHLILNYVDEHPSEVSETFIDLTRKSDGLNALNISIVHRHEKLAIDLLKRGASVDIEHPKLGTPLHQTAQACMPELATLIVSQLKDTGALQDHIDRTTSEGHATPLRLAAQTGCTEVLQLLLLNGANPNGSKALNEVAPMTAAVLMAQPWAVIYLKQYGASTQVNAQNPSALFYASYFGLNSEVKRLMKAKASPYLRLNFLTGSGSKWLDTSPLYLAHIRSQVKIFRSLLQYEQTDFKREVEIGIAHKDQNYIRAVLQGIRDKSQKKRGLMFNFMQASKSNEAQDDSEEFRRILIDLFQPTCGICLEDLTLMEQAPSLAFTPCGHLFCEHCIRSWITHEPSANPPCPNCRMPLNALQTTFTTDPNPGLMSGASGNFF